MSTTFKNDRRFTKAEIKSLAVLFAVAILIAFAINYTTAGVLLSK